MGLSIKVYLPGPGPLPLVGKKRQIFTHKGRIHGNDERISIENVKLGTRLMLEIVQEVVY